MDFTYSIIVPCFNEKQTVGSVASKLCEEFKSCLVVFIDDGSTDGSKEILRGINYSNFYLIELKENHGKGYAMRSGLNYVKDKSSVAIFTDSDNEIDIVDLNKVIEKFRNPEIAAVYGSRFLNVSLKTVRSMGIERYLANRLFTLISNIRNNQKLTDSQTAVKSFKLDLLEKLDLKSSGFNIESEIVKALSKNKVKIYEVPISYNPRSVKEGKKISFKDGLIVLKELFK